MEFLSKSGKSADARVNACIEYLAKNDMENMPIGRYDVCEGIYVMIQEYETKPAAEKRFEVHRAYADLQTVISGSEVIGFGLLGDAKGDGYDAEKDIDFTDDIESRADLLLMPGDCAVFMPDDAHKPGCAVGSVCGKVRKAVFKIKL